MKKEDLIKKLERVEFPEIELRSHRRALKNVLFDLQEKQIKKSWFVSPIRRMLAPVGTIGLIILTIFIINTVIYPSYTLAQVRRIAENNPEIQRLMASEGVRIKDIKVVENRAYVLLTPEEKIEKKEERKEPDSVLAEAEKEKRFNASLVEIEIKEKRVVEIKTIGPIFPSLSAQEEEKAKKMVEKLESEKSRIMETQSAPSEIKIEKEFSEPESIKVEKFEPLPTSPYELKLMRRDGRVEVLPEKNAEKGVRVIYKTDGENKASEVYIKKVEQ